MSSRLRTRSPSPNPGGDGPGAPPPSRAGSLAAARSRLRASRSPDSRSSAPDPSGPDGAADPSAAAVAATGGGASPSRLEQARNRRKEAAAQAAAAEPKEEAEKTNLEKEKERREEARRAADEFFEDADTLMVQRRPVQIFKEERTIVMDDVVEEDPNLFHPEAFQAIRGALGYPTERDKEDLESFESRKVRRTEASFFRRLRRTFNKKMFGTDYPTATDGPIDEDEEDDLLNSLLREEGLFVPKGPEGAEDLVLQGRLYSRLKRDGVQAAWEQETRNEYAAIMENVDPNGIVPRLNPPTFLNGDTKDGKGKRQLSRVPESPASNSATANFGATFHGDGGRTARGPSTSADFFHADGNPRLPEDPVIPGSHRPVPVGSDDHESAKKGRDEHLQVRVQKVRGGAVGNSHHPDAPSIRRGGDKDSSKGGSGSASMGTFGAKVGGGDLRTELVVSIPRMALYDHEDFNAEERIYSAMRLMYGKYQAHVESGSVAFLTRRLNALVSDAHALKEQLKDADPSNPDASLDLNNDGIDDAKQLRMTYEEILETVGVRLAEEHELRCLGGDLYEAWRALCKERENQGFYATPAKLIARAVDFRGGIDADAGDQALSTGLKGRILEQRRKDAGVETKSMEDVVNELKGVLPWLQDFTLRSERAAEEKKARKLVETAVGDSRLDHLPETMEEIEKRSRRVAADEERKVELLLAACDALLPKGGTDYMLRLTGDEQYLRTEDCKAIGEKNRRARITKGLYYCQLQINGNTVGRTQAKTIDWPTMTCVFNKRFRCRLLRRPQSIKVQLFRSAGLLTDVLISESLINVPGLGAEHDNATTHSLAPVVAWYQFAASRTVASEGDHALRRLHGGLMVGAEWGLERVTEDGKVLSSDQGEMAPLLPERPQEAENGRLQGLKRSEIEMHRLKMEGDLNQKPPDFAKERDFLALMPHLTRIDPNDPRNAGLIRLGELLLPSQLSKDIFRTVENELAAGFKVPGTTNVYHNIYSWEQPRRHQLLKLRQLKPTLFSAPIPLSEIVIKKDENYRGILAAERRKHAVDDDTEVIAATQRKAVDKSNIKDFVKRIRDSQQAEQRRRMKRQVYHSEVVQEGTLPDFVKFNFDIQDIVNFFVPPRKRGLRPPVKSRAAVTALVRNCRLMVTIVGARNVPSRVLAPVAGPPGSPKKRGTSPVRRRKASAGDEEEEEQEVSFDAVHSFVSVKFQDQDDKTRPVSGAAPLWKQTLTVPFRPPMGDFSPAHLSQVRDNLEVMLFDEVEVNYAEGGGYYEDELTTRTDRRFLGNLSIPFSTIYMAGKVEGTFRLTSPDVCLGYTKRTIKVLEPGSEAAYINDDSERAPDAGGDEGKPSDADGGIKDVSGPVAMGGPTGAQLISQAESCTYVKIMATLEPLLVAPGRDSSPVQSKEEKRLVKYAKNWEQSCIQHSSSTKDRVFELLVPDIHGYKWLATRYLRPQAPPPGCESVKEAAHFVSLVPFLEDWQAFLGDYEMWCTSQQFLDILAGDWEEHAILLANYFMFLSEKFPDKCGAEVYLVLGSGIPEGQTVYVMRKDNLTQDIVFWNASAGVAYARDDERCPLNNVGTLITRENAYANIQKSGKPFEMGFNLEDKKHWKPFYNQFFVQPKTPLPSIQDPVLRYTVANNQFAEELEDELLNTLKRDIRRWRRNATSFKGDTSGRLREILSIMEDERRGVSLASKREQLNRLESASKGREMFGLPLHFAFTDVQEIVNKIESTGIHSCRDPDAEFALGVRCFPYASNVISVWVFFVALAPRRT